MSEIINLRNRIEQIDDEIAKLICQRQLSVKCLDILKKYNKMQVRNLEIEKSKISRVRAIAKDHSIDPKITEDVIRILISHSILAQV